MKKLLNIKMPPITRGNSATLILFGLLALSACSQEKSVVTVSHYGVLMEIMREQKIEANADLQDFRNQPHLFALGALEGLSGEVLILDSKPLNGLASEGNLLFDRSFDRKATLLVSAQVEDWKEISLVLESVDLSQLQTMVKEAAQQLSINTEEAFPFLLKGQFGEIDWHVINAGEAEAQNHEAFRKAGLSGKSENVEGQLLGFYSEKHEGVFTHHGSFMHMHFVNTDETEMGHVDALEITGPIVLLLPNPEQP